MKNIIRISLEVLIAAAIITTCLLSYFLVAANELIYFGELLIYSLALLITTSVLRTNLSRSVFSLSIVIFVSVFYLFVVWNLEISNLYYYFLTSTVMLFAVFDGMIKGRTLSPMKIFNAITFTLIFIMFMIDIQIIELYYIAGTFLVTNAILTAVSVIRSSYLT